MKGKQTFRTSFLPLFFFNPFAKRQPAELPALPAVFVKKAECMNASPMGESRMMPGQTKKSRSRLLRDFYRFDYLAVPATWAATSAAKSSTFFSMPSPLM